MPLPYDADPILDSLQDELRMKIASLNELYHPVYPADPKRVAEIERVVAEIRMAIAARRRELGGSQAPMAGEPVSASAQAKGPDRVGQGV